MRYGSHEYKYAAPIAQALIEDAPFRQWVLSQSEYSDWSDAKLLHQEMAQHRGNATAEWWRFYFTEKCRCLGCSGKETDLLAIFESASKVRFALHFEIKQPTDDFKADGIQSRGYPLRAQCWAISPPKRVLPHNRASTGLIFSEARRADYAHHLGHFNSLITFEDIEREHPQIANWLAT